MNARTSNWYIICPSLTRELPLRTYVCRHTGKLMSTKLLAVQYHLHLKNGSKNLDFLENSTSSIIKIIPQKSGMQIVYKKIVRIANKKLMPSSYK